MGFFGELETARVKKEPDGILPMPLEDASIVPTIAVPARSFYHPSTEITALHTAFKGEAAPAELKLLVDNFSCPKANWRVISQQSSKRLFLVYEDREP